MWAEWITSHLYKMTELMQRLKKAGLLTFAKSEQQYTY